MITIKNLDKKIKNQQSLKISNLNFNKGYIYSILGHNGSGKSTLLKILYNIEDFQSGKITINTEDTNIDAVYENMAYNPQQNRFLSGSLKDNFDYIYKYSKNKDLLSKDKLDNLLKEFELDMKLDTNVKRLSGGEQGKAQFIRTLIMNKNFILLDEPMANMDLKTIKKVEEKILELKEEKKTVILVTHDFIQAKRLSDYIVFMENLNYINTYNCEDFFEKYGI
ncbi:MAG: ATP-binding cassette domain-containing protein [Romboutsia sp.]|uniref:ATP-binding cassette domain-containing protein n=1 Tax=Romboutsia sp. TaxID=1965302 RepID=UPI003F353022